MCTRKKELREAESKIVTGQIAILEENNSFFFASVHCLTPISKRVITSFSKTNAILQRDVQLNLRQIHCLFCPGLWSLEYHDATQWLCSILFFKIPLRSNHRKAAPPLPGLKSTNSKDNAFIRLDAEKLYK